jgi:DNA-binding response OmpR family regulator
MDQHKQALREAQPEAAHQEEGFMESVLIVDPDVAVHEQLEQMLQGLFVLRHARMAAEALDAIGRQRPNLIISEVDLPDGTGLALCEWVRATAATSRIPFLLLTTRSEIDDKVSGFLAGADDYVVKPIDPRFFSARIRLLFRLKALEQKPSPGNTPPPHPPGSPLPRPERFPKD